MSGLQLKKMEASEMVDVLHFLYEDDVMPNIDQGMEIQSKVRDMVYNELYNRPYKYKLAPNANGMANADGSPARLEDNPLPPDQLPVKPYIPPTDPEYLDKILGMGPMGGG